MFTENEKILPTKSWIMSFKELDKNDIDPSDEFFFERREIVTFVQLVEYFEENLEEIYKKAPDFNLRELKEEMLSSGYSGFSYDW